MLLCAGMAAAYVKQHFVRNTVDLIYFWSFFFSSISGAEPCQVPLDQRASRRSTSLRTCGNTICAMEGAKENGTEVKLLHTLFV